MKDIVFIQNDVVVTDSLLVSEVFDKDHKRVLQDIRELNCSEEFGRHHFVPISYTDSMNREKPKYIMTEQGFMLLVMGYTGSRAMEFKEQYIAEFHRMRDELNNRDKNKVVPLDERQVRMELLKTALEHDARLESIEGRIVQVERKLEEQITLDSGSQRSLQKAVARRVYDLASDFKTRKELFNQLYREIKDRWAVPSYKDVRKTELSEVLRYVEAWKPRIA